MDGHRGTWLMAMLLLGWTAQRAPGQAASAAKSDTPAESFSLKFEPDGEYYVVVESELRDGASIPPLLAYASTVIDKKTFAARVSIPTTGPATSVPFGAVKWECIRHEVREKGFGEETTYDSLRDSYPPTSLRNLAGVAGAQVTFRVNPQNGQTDTHFINPGKSAAPEGRASPSKTTERAALSVENLKQLLDDIGPLYWPPGPQRAGDHWTKTLRESHGTFGTVVIELTCTLRGVDTEGGRRIAVIDLAGKPSHEAPPAASNSPRPSASQPASGPAASQQKRSYELERGLFAGTVKFDLTRGRLAELVLRRDFGFLAELEGKDQAKTQVRTNVGQVLKVNVSDAPPPKPLIVGGPKPPPEKVKEDRTRLLTPGNPAPVMGKPQPNSAPASSPSQP